MTMQDHIESYAKQLVGNWKRFSNFMWFDHPSEPDVWCIVHTHNRDSKLMEKSNAQVIALAMSQCDKNDYRSMRSSHCLCGWIDGYAIRVYDAKGNITQAFATYAELLVKIEDYPILDEKNHSRMVFDATLENIAAIGTHGPMEARINDKAPEDWPAKVYDWLVVHDAEDELENLDDRGGDPSSKAIGEALADMGWLHTNE